MTNRTRDRQYLWRGPGAAWLALMVVFAVSSRFRLPAARHGQRSDQSCHRRSHAGGAGNLSDGFAELRCACAHRGRRRTFLDRHHVRAHFQRLSDPSLARPNLPRVSRARFHSSIFCSPEPRLRHSVRSRRRTASDGRETYRTTASRAKGTIYVVKKNSRFRPRSEIISHGQCFNRRHADFGACHKCKCCNRNSRGKCPRTDRSDFDALTVKTIGLLSTRAPRCWICCVSGLD